MFAKFFGGNNQQGSQPQPQQKPVEKTTEQDQLEYTKTINLVSQQIAILEQSQDKYQLRQEKIENDIRLLVAAKKKNQAKTKILEMKNIEKAILTFENKKNVFLDMKMQLELAKGNSMSLIVVENVNKLFSKNKTIQDDLTNALDDYKEHQQDQKEIDNLWAQAQGDQEDVEEDYEKYLNENEEKESQIFQNQMNQLPSINIPQQQQQKLQNNNINNAWQAQMNS